MAKAKLSPVLQMLAGALGDVVFKQYGKKIVVSKRPVFDSRIFTRSQKENQDRFKQGASYIAAVRQDSAVWEAYREAGKATAKPACAVAVRDFFNPPQVDRIDLHGYRGNAGGKILVHATDDFGVTRVEVRLVDERGNILEQGAAIQASGNVWAYATTAAVAPGTTVNVDATAYDRPGHSGTLTETVQTS